LRTEGRQLRGKRTNFAEHKTKENNPMFTSTLLQHFPQTVLLCHSKEVM